MKKPTKFNRDTSSYRFNGKTYTKKIDFVRDVVRFYFSEHPETTHADLKEAFSFKRNMDKVFMPYDEYLAILDEKGTVSFFGTRPDIPTIQLADKKIVVCTNWPMSVNGQPAEFSKFLDMLRKKLGYKIDAC